MTREEILAAAEMLYRVAWIYVTPRERTELVELWERLHAPLAEEAVAAPPIPPV